MAAEARVVCGSELSAIASGLLGRDEEERAALAACAQGRPLTHGELAAVARARRRAAPPGAAPAPALATLLRGLELPREPEPARDPEHERRMQRLRERAAVREYEAMTRDLPGSRGAGGVPGALGSAMGHVQEAHRASKDVGVGLMMLLLCVAVFMAVKFFVDGPGGGDASQQGTIAGLLAGTAMLIIEMVLFVIRATKDEGYERERARVSSRQLHNLAPFPAPKAPFQQTGSSSGTSTSSGSDGGGGDVRNARRKNAADKEE
jgi:hypothetical protein